MSWSRVSPVLLFRRYFLSQMSSEADCMGISVLRSVDAPSMARFSVTTGFSACNWTTFIDSCPPVPAIFVGHTPCLFIGCNTRCRACNLGQPLHVVVLAPTGGRCQDCNFQRVALGAGAALSFYIGTDSRMG